MYVYMYIYLFVCHVHVCLRVYLYTCTCTCTCTCTKVVYFCVYNLQTYVRIVEFVGPDCSVYSELAGGIYTLIIVAAWKIVLAVYVARDTMYLSWVTLVHAFEATCPASCTIVMPNGACCCLSPRGCRYLMIKQLGPKIRYSL